MYSFTTLLYNLYIYMYVSVDERSLLVLFTSECNIIISLSVLKSLPRRVTHSLIHSLIQSFFFLLPLFKRAFVQLLLSPVPRLLDPVQHWDLLESNLRS